MSTIDTSLSGTLSGVPSGNRFNELTSEDFVKIMFTELSNQDPLKPNDSNALLQQMSSLRSIESDLALSKKLDAVVSQNQLATAGGLLGKYVTGYTDVFEPAEGIVRSVTQTLDGPVLNLVNGARVPFGNVTQFREPPAPTTPTTPTGNTGGTTNPPQPASPPTPRLADPDHPMSDDTDAPGT